MTFKVTISLQVDFCVIKTKEYVFHTYMIDEGVLYDELAKEFDNFTNNILHIKDTLGRVLTKQETKKIEKVTFFHIDITNFDSSKHHALCWADTWDWFDAAETIIEEMKKLYN